MNGRWRWCEEEMQSGTLYAYRHLSRRSIEENAMIDEPEQSAEVLEREEEPSWRRWLPWIALVVIVVVVIWLLSQFSNPPKPDDVSVDRGAAEYVKVPDVVGLTENEAEAVLVASGLKVENGVSMDQFADPGTVAAQKPDPGRKVESGSIVLIEVVPAGGVRGAGLDEEGPDYSDIGAGGIKSRAPKTVREIPVPDLVGLSEGDAVAAIEAAGFQARVMYQPRDRATRQVAEQRPSAGDMWPEGELVHVLIFVPR